MTMAEVEEDKIEDRAVRTDAAIRDLIAEFNAWRRAERRPPDSGGLDHMLDFVEDAIERSVPVATAVLDRLDHQIPQLFELASPLHPDVALCLRYVVTSKDRDLGGLQDDEFFWKSVEGLQLADYQMQPSDDGGFTGLLNATFGSRVNETLTDAWSYLRKGSRDQKTLDDLAIPAARWICSAGLNLPLYISSMQMGYNAWDRGAEIVMTIYNHMMSPESAGQLCSLTPPGVPARVDIPAQPWMRDPAFLEWLEASHEQTEPLMPDDRAAISARLQEWGS